MRKIMNNLRGDKSLFKAGTRIGGPTDATKLKPRELWAFMDQGPACQYVGRIWGTDRYTSYGFRYLEHECPEGHSAEVTAHGEVNAGQG